MCAVTAEGVYVAMTRVRRLGDLRVWPLPKGGLDYLLELRWPWELLLYDRNYDANGYWKSDGLLGVCNKRKAQARNMLLKIPDITVARGKDGRDDVTTSEEIRRLL